MEISTLIRMANRIGDFFEALPDQDEAAEGIANHIQKFWEPRMRRELLGFLDAHPDGRVDDECQLHPLVLGTVTAQRQRLTPSS